MRVISKEIEWEDKVPHNLYIIESMGDETTNYQLRGEWSFILTQPSELLLFFKNYFLANPQPYEPDKISKAKGAI